MSSVRQQPPLTAPGWRPRVQVSVEHYRSRYDDWDKWLTYFWSIRNVCERGLREVLEVGVGTKVVCNYLRNQGVALTTLDLDPGLEPDHVGSVTELPFADEAFDAVICTEVLEHMPWDCTRRAIEEIHRVTRRYAFVTVPHFALSLALLVRLPVLQLHEFRLRLPWPRPLQSFGQHFWECGRPGYPVSRLRRAFRRAGFVIASERRPPTQYSSCFFVLDKRGRTAP
jgi:SAM-dependent methyltransferase